MIEPRPTALITGAATRIGRIIALHLAERGWNIAVHYGRSEVQALQTVADIRAFGADAQCLQADLADANTLKPLMETAHSHFGIITALINNAAIFERDTPQTITPESVSRHQAVNLHAPLLLSRYFAAQLPEGVRGHIINLTDGGGAYSLTPRFLSYALSKQALEHATLLLADAYAPHIQVNAIGPRLTLPQAGEEAAFERLVAQSPTGQTDSPQHIAKLVHNLLTNADITGQILTLSGEK